MCTALEVWLDEATAMMLSADEVPITPMSFAPDDERDYGRDDVGDVQDDEFGHRRALSAARSGAS